MTSEIDVDALITPSPQVKRFCARLRELATHGRLPSADLHHLAETVADLGLLPADFAREHPGGSISREYRSCGSKACKRCRDGKRGHGPYRYYRYRERDEDGRVRERKKYLGRIGSSRWPHKRARDESGKPERDEEEPEFDARFLHD